MYKKGDVFKIGEDCPIRGYVGTIGMFVDEVENEGGSVRGKVDLFVRGPEVTVEDGKEWVFSQMWVRNLEKIGEGGIYVGQRVKICPESNLYGQGGANPRDECGEVRQYRPLDGLRYPFEVLWDVGTYNSYGAKDLLPGNAVAQPKPKPLKKSPRKQIMEAVKLLNDCDQDATAKYCILYGGQDVKINPSMACHAGLNRAKKGATAVVSCIKKGVDENPWFYKWLIDESPWAPAFMRRYRWSRENKVVVVRTDVSCTFMCGALYATRSWEYHIQKEFLKTFRRKFPMALLYPISCMAKSSGREWRFETSGGDHFPFHHMPSKEVVKNFMAGVVKNVEPNFQELDGKRGSVNGVFGEAGRPDHWVLKKFKDFEGVSRRSRWGDFTYYTKNVKVMEAFLASVQEEIYK